MQITNTPNFEGAYRIKPNEVKAKIEIPELFTQGRQVFHDILEKGDEVVVLRPQYDKRVSKYVQENNVSGIEYYPQIHTKLGLDNEKPEGLLALLKDKSTKIITDIQEICKITAKQRKFPKRQKSLEVVEKISDALRLNIEKPSVVSTAESTVIKDKQKQRTIEVIQHDRGTYYVHLKPDSLYGDNVRCILDNNGKIVKSFETPDEIRKFIVKFNKMKQEKRNILID